MSYIAYTKEGQILYSHNPEYGLSPFTYHTYHIPSGKSMENVVFVQNETAFKRLLNHWNLQQPGTWDYFSLR